MEHIKNIAIHNFKSIKDLKINDCKKINVLVGYPNAGKSNILEALGTFQFCKDEANIKFNNDNSIGKFPLSDVVRYDDFSDLFFEGNIFSKTLISINNLELNLNYDKINLNNKNVDDYKYVFGYENILGNDNRNIKNELKKFIEIKKYSFKLPLTQKHILDLPSLNYPFGNNIGQIISSNPKLRNEVNQFFLKNNLKLLIEKGTNELKIFKEFEDGTVFTLPYSMIADTLQRLIFYKAAIMSNKDSVLLFEEPEAHCFEPYILEFTNAVKYDENNNQYFIVTHSQFVIDELLRDEESRNNTQIYLVNNIDNKTQIKKLNEENNDDVYQYGMNVFFNFENLWQTN